MRNANLLQTLSHHLALWRRRQRERRSLLTLSDFELQDIGITRSDAQREAAKPFWRR
jgi:uncharacterized protein YjiS (DUF1127 family)